MLLVDKDLSTEEKFLIFKNFCKIYKNMHSNEDVTEFMTQVKLFRKDLKLNAIRVEDLKNRRGPPQQPIWVSALWEMLRGLFLLPFFTFFIPVRTILIGIAERKRVQALSNSVVKGGWTVTRSGRLRRVGHQQNSPFHVPGACDSFRVHARVLLEFALHDSDSVSNSFQYFGGFLHYYSVLHQILDRSLRQLHGRFSTRLRPHQTQVWEGTDQNR